MLPRSEIPALVNEKGFFSCHPGFAGLKFVEHFPATVYNLPPDPVAPTKTVKETWRSFGWAVAGLAAVAIGSVFASKGER